MSRFASVFLLVFGVGNLLGSGCLAPGLAPEDADGGELSGFGDDDTLMFVALCE